MEKVLYAFIVGSLMYAQVCTCADIAFVVSVLKRYLSKPSVAHQQAAKRVMRYLQGTKDYILIYKRSNNLKVIGYSEANYGGCPNDHNSTSNYIIM